MCKLCENTINYGIVQFKWVNCTGCKLYLKKGAKCIKFIVCQPHLKKWSSQPGLLYHPQTVWLINKRIFSHIPEDRKSRIKALAGLVSGSWGTNVCLLAVSLCGKGTGELSRSLL